MTDENTLVIPDAWQRVRHPRRDRPDVPEPSAPDPDLVERAHTLVARARDGIEEVLGLPGTVPEIADAARAHLRGEPDPLGAAAVAHVATTLRDLDRTADGDLFQHVWVADHGIAFAVAAYAEMGGIIDISHYVRGRGRSTGVRHRGPDESYGGRWLDQECARWLRGHLAAAPGDVYAEAVEGLAARRVHGLQRLLTAYLAPTREDWVEDLCANPGPAATDHHPERWLLFCALGRPHQPAALGLPLGFGNRTLGALVSLVDGVGPEAAAPLLIEAMDDRHTQTYGPYFLVDVLAGLPLDDAFAALVDRIDRAGVLPALPAALRRFPARALRLLPASNSARAADLLAAHVRRHRDLAETVVHDLPARSAKAVGEILDADTRLPDAADPPPLLTEPPWTRPGKKVEPVVIKDLPLPGGPAVAAWAPGEREEWTARRLRRARWVEKSVPEKDVADFTAGTLPDSLEGPLFAEGPDDLVRPLLATWKPGSVWTAEEWLPIVVGRFGADAAHAALCAARQDPAALASALLPLRSDGIARTMAEWLVRLKVAGKAARVWFARHGLAAVPPLIPDALGKAGPARRAAEAALRLVAELHGPEPVVEAARVHGDKAAAGIDALLSADPLDNLPKKIPSTGWVETEALPQLLLRDRTRALPDDAVRHVLTMFAMSTLDDVYAGVRTVREHCDPQSLAEFGWALFRWWDACGTPAKEGWALTQLALTGDDDTVRRLAPVIRAWPGESGHAKAVTGLDVLAAIGTETALMHLHGIAQRVKFKGLRTKAQEKIEQVAAELELTADELADRLVPDFGLDASGTLTLDYGPRRFVIGFDEHLKPTVADEDGKPRKSLPKPGAKDDPELAPAAAKRFAALKKDVRTVAADQLRRLEQAMIARRRWPLAEFETLLVGHTLLRHLVRRLVWVAEDGPAFRVAEDGTFANVEDDTVTLSGTARVGIAHPIDLPDDLAAWSEVFADYAILQPFPQLGRPVHTLTGDERESGRLTRFENVTVPPGVLLGLVSRGWERGTPMDAGVEAWISRPVGGGRYVVIAFRPGITVDFPDEFGDQEIDGVVITERPEDVYFTRDLDTDLRFGDLDPVAASEILADLEHVTRKDA